MVAPPRGYLGFAAAMRPTPTGVAQPVWLAIQPTDLKHCGCKWRRAATRVGVGAFRAVFPG